jgi:YD repeat-containing protein
MKKTTSIIAILFIQYTFSQNVSNNENTPNFRPPTPEMNSLFKFTDIPVSQTTGVPNISVPIYEIKLKDFVLPISLSYHSAGIHIEEVSSNIGLGWSLNAGGMISSNVIGLPDNGNRSEIPQDRELIPDVDNPPNCGLITEPDYTFVKELSESGQERDIQPDIFYYSYPNSNGKFFISNDNTIHTMPYVPIKIIRENNFKFIIIDEKGNKFTYDVLENRRSVWGIVRSISKVSNTSGYMDSYSYFLSKVETTNKEIINFEYEDQSYEYNDPDTYTRFKADFPTTTTGCISNLPLYDEKQTANSTIIHGKRLKSITSSTNENIVFFYDNCPRLDLPATNSLPQSQSITGSFALNRIEVKRGQTSDNYYFEHGYFNLNNYTPCVSQSNEETKNSYRLKLLSVRKNNDIPYTFEYDESCQLPSRLSDSYDHWGFFRNGGGRYPKDYVYSFYDGADRSPNLEYTKLGILKKIKYPTSGYSLFNYEENESFGPGINANPPVDRGIALYIEGDEGHGIPNDPNAPFYLTESFQISNIIPSSFYVTCSTSPERDQTTTNWTSIYITDDKGKTFSFVTTNNQTTKLDLPDGNYILHVNGVFAGGGARIFWQEKSDVNNATGSENFKVGGLRIKSIFNYDNILINEPSLKTFYEYNQFGDSQKSSGKIINYPRYSYVAPKIEFYCSDCTGGMSSLVNNYQVYLAQNSRSIVSLNGLLGNHIMYSQVRVFNQENKQEGYTDYRYQEVDSDNIEYMVTPNTPVTSYDFMRGDLLEESLFKYNTTLNTFSLVRNKKYEYKINFSNQDFFSVPSLPNENYCIGLNLTTLNAETKCVSGGFGVFCTRAPASFSLGYYKLFSIWKYLERTTESTFDTNGNTPIIVETNYKYNNPLHCQVTSVVLSSSDKQVLENKYYYPYDYSGIAVYDSMIAKNMIATPIDTQTFKNFKKLSEQKTTYRNWGNNLLAPEIVQTAKGNNELEDRVKYSLVDNTNGNVLEYKRENGTPVSIVWGYNKTQPIAYVENSSYSEVSSYVTNLQTVADTGSEVNLLAALALLRNSLPNAMVTTYTYIPLVGVSTITDPKGYKITYTYDADSRLQYVKDAQGNLLSENQYHYKN